MTAPGSVLLICRDGRIIAARGGPYVHNRPLTEPVDQLAMVTALTSDPLPDEHSTLVHSAPGAERSRLMESYLAGLTDGVRDRLVIKPSREALEPIDVAALESLSDHHDLPLLLPVADELKRSARAVPVDATGYETVWSRATSVRLLTRGQAAARTSARDAIRTAAGEERPSVQRLAEWSRRSARTREGLDGSRIPPAAEAFAVHLARYGVPEGADVEAVLRPAMAPTWDTVLTAIGGTAAEADPARLVAGLVAHPGSAALVRFRRDPDGPAQVAWLMSADRRSALFWLEPGAGPVAVPTTPDAEDPYLALLSRSGTVVVPVDATGRATTVDDLAGAADPADDFVPPPLQRVNSGFSVLDDHLRDLVGAQVAHGRHLIGELVDLSKQQFVKESPRAATTVLVSRVRVARAVSRLEDDARHLPGPRRRVAPALHEQIVARIAASVEHFGQVSEHASHRIRDLIEDATYESYLATRDDKVRARAKKVLEYASKALNMSGPLFLPAGASFAPAAMELGTTAATMAAVKAFESWQLRHFRNGHAVGEVWLRHDDDPLIMAKAIVKGQSDALALLMSAAGIGGAYVPGWPIIASAITKVLQRYLDERVTRAAQQLAGVDVAARRTLWREVLEDVWRDLTSEVKGKLKDPGTLKEFVNAVRGEPDVIGLVNIVSDVAVNAALGALVALLPPKPASPVTGEMLRSAVLGVVGMLKDGWEKPEPTGPGPLPDETVPPDVASTDSEGRPVTHYREMLSDDRRAYVAVTFNGKPIWGYLTRGSWEFEPVRPHESAFADLAVWHDRIPGPDHYLQLSADGTERTRVPGSWYRPWPGQFHYLFVGADGVLEWAHAMAPTSRMDTDEYNVHRHFEEHPEWLREFGWTPGEVLDLDFDREGFAPASGTWSARQFAYSVAHQLVADHQAVGGAWRTRVHVEGGGNGRNFARSTWAQWRHEATDRAVESGQRRADAAYTTLRALVAEELRRITAERGLAADDVPAVLDGVFAAPTSRGSALHASRAPGRSTATADDRRNRQVYVWVERVAVTPESSDPPSPVVSDDGLPTTPGYADAAARLARVAEDLPAVTGTDRNDACVTAVRDFAAETFPRGVRPAAVGGPVDDSDIGTAHVFPAVADRHFTLTESWAEVRERLSAAGPGAVAFVLLGRPGRIGHAAAAWYDGAGLVFANLTRPAGARVSTRPGRLPSPVDLRTLVVDRTGAVRPARSVPESASTPRALVDAADPRYGMDSPGDGSPRPELHRVSSKLTDRELRGIVDERLARGTHLLEVAGRLSKYGFVSEAPGNRLMVHHERSRLSHAMDDLREQADTVLRGAPVTVTPEHVQAGAELFESAAEFSRLSADVGRRIGALVLGEGVKGYLATRNDRTGVWVKRALGVASKALSLSAPAFLPAGASAAPAALDFATTVVTHASMKAFLHWQKENYLRNHSAAEALLAHDDDPLTMAKAIVKSQTEAVELLMAAAGIGGAYVPGWPIIASAITKVVQGYLEERVQRAAEQAAAASGATRRELWNRVGENVWKGLRSEVTAKVKDPATVKQIVDAARGDADVLGLVNIGSDIAVSAMLGALVALMPPKPAQPVTGDMLRTAVSAMAGTAGTGAHVSVPDEPGTPTEEDVPPDLRTEDAEGRPVTRYRADRSDDRRAYVTVDFNGQSVWGHLDRDTGDFEPVEPHQSAFVDSTVWYNRVLAADHYLQLPPEGADPTATRTRVDGRWYRPSWDKFHYLYLFVRTDGTVEWAHGTAPTGRIAGPTSQVHQVLSGHPQWVRDFTWRTPGVLAVDFEPGEHTAAADPWSLRQFAYAVADRAVAARSAPGGAWTRPLVHVEGGGNGHGTVHEVVDALRHVHADHAVESGHTRARGVYERLKPLVAQELRRIAAERGLADDEVPPSVDELFAAPTSRGAALDASQAPGMGTAPPDDARNRQVYVWIEHVPLTPESSDPPSPVVSDPASALRLSTVDIVSRAQAIGRTPETPAVRLHELVTAVEEVPDADLDTALADCVPRAYAAFVAYHGRAANTSDVEAASDPARMRIDDLAYLLGGAFEPLADVDRVRDQLRAEPGAMALLRLPADGNRPGHVYWLWSEPGGAGPTLRWIDTQDPGLLDTEAFADPDDVHATAARRAGVTVLRLGADGRPARTDGTAEVARDVAALTLARGTTAEPGMRQALNKVAPTRILHGTGTPAQTRAAELRDDVRTVFLGGDQRADRKTLDGALSALSRRPVRIVPPATVSADLLDWLRGRAARAKVPVFVPGVGQRAVVDRGDLAARWPDGMPGDWVRIGGDPSGGYATVDSGHLARSVAPGEKVTAGELVADELRTARVPVQLDPLPGELVGIRFGPEIEYDAGEGVDPDALNRAVITDLREFGRTEQDAMATYHDTMLAGYRSDRAGWKIERDSTVTGEIVAPILPYAPGRWYQTWYDLALVRAVIRRHGGVYSERAGGHLHVSVASFGQQAPKLANLLRHVLHRMDVLFRIGANGLYHRGSGQTAPFPPRAFDDIGGLDWEGLIRLGGKKSALSLDALKDSIGDPERDHVELRIPDGIDDLGHLQFLVRVVQRLVDAAGRSGPAGYAPQRLGERFGDRSADVDRAGLDLVRELFGADAPAVEDQLRAVWANSRWQPALEHRVRRYGMEIGSVPAAGTYGRVGPAQHRANTAALRALTRGMPQPVIVFHHLDAASLPVPGTPQGSLVDPQRNLRTLRGLLANHGSTGPRPLVVLFEPRGSAVVGPAHERDLDAMADEYRALVVRPHGGPVTTVRGRLSTVDGWELREPGGRTRPLGPVLRRDQLDELVVRGPDAARTDQSDPGLWDRLAGSTDGGLRWVGAPPETVDGWLRRTGEVGAARERPVLVLRPDRTGPRGTPQYSRARLDALDAQLTDDPFLARTGVLLVAGDAGPVAALRRQHRIATVFRGDAGPSGRGDWRLVTWDGELVDLGDALDHRTVGRVFDHLDGIAAADAGEALAALDLDAGPSTATRAQDPLVTPPPGSAWDGRVLALGSWDGPARAQLDQLRDWAGDLTRPVVAVHAPSPATRAHTMNDLDTTLLRFARVGVHPIVLANAVDRATFDDLRDRYRPVTVQRTTAGFDDVWQLRTPGGDADRLVDRPSGGLLRRADELPATPTGYELPRVLADWLALNDWPARGEYLRAHAAELITPDVAGHLDRVPDAEAGPYRVLVDVVRRDGGESAPRSDTRPETFVVEYLEPRGSAQDRKPWNDRLLRLVARNELTAAQAARLARGLPEPNAESHARVFDAIDGVLAMTPEQAAVDHRTNARLTALLNEMVGCDVTPTDRMFWVYRMDEFRDGLRAAGRAAHADLVDVLTYTLANC
ncbi:hypothetical protein [Actinocatenispora rupis]|uniref:Papain fold toxin 1, glutamine deamidase n=1 Tax=Actinocatenispora rupis TaxID=519421 RepID=A0A8J3JFJ3_9ACTN|nr:hypothetical protein [Actinocatenispora rupis]GID15013.1 hypothetical protein Aru02nite_59020 [Actinocatenispora rupis]